MRRVVISQPMFFPWVGMYEQLRLADVFVEYADVQFSKGSFTNRVQIKTAEGPKWLTVPLADLRLGQRIDEVRIDDRRDWRHGHLELLRQAYRDAAHREDMLGLVRSVYESAPASLNEVARASFMAGVRYFGLDANRIFEDSRNLGVPGAGSQRVLDIVQKLGGTHYVTGHGAQHYLDHDAFERAGLRVEYMNYKKIEYEQLHGPFTPYVSILDLIANEGRAGLRRICSSSVYWKEFLHG